MTSSITDVVRKQYADLARSGLSNAHAGVQAVAEAFGYTAEELLSLPAEANMGLSCGNPTATAHLKPGETVVDLGCGGGIDVLLAARKVGPSGRAIGIDLTPEMIERAKANAAKAGLSNAEFYLAPMEQLPLPDASVDCLISNCVINLAADKRQVFREMFRVLKPGGRVAVSDIALKQPLPDELARSIAAYVGCISGALLIDDYRSQLAEAGFTAVQVVDTGKDLNAYAKIENQAGCCSPAMDQPAAAPAPETKPTATAGSTSGLPLVADDAGCCAPGPSAAQPADTPGMLSELAALIQRYDLNQFAASVQVFALKPAN
jgi:arsenite methyltransferase